MMKTNLKKSLNRFVFLILLITLLLPAVSSLGITPGRTSLDYKPDIEQEVTFSVLNNENKNLKVLLTAQGELSEYITLYNSTVSFLPSEESKQFIYKIKVPASLGAEPGLHTAEIVVLEIPEPTGTGTYVGATVAVVSQAFVYVPCPGKCIETGLDVLNAEQNGTATFIIPVINRGKLGIGEARAIIDIYNSFNEKIDSIETDNLAVPSGSRTELSAKWNVNAPSGNYLAKVSVFYDGETKNFEELFAVGIESLSVESIFVNNFQLGEIAKLEILVENKWNQILENVFANLLVFNNENQVMADIKSSNEEIPALSKKQLILYWDTVGVEEGEYNGKLSIKYGKKSSDKNLILKVSEDSLDIFGVGYAIQPKGGKGIEITTILIVVIILLIVMNISWFVFFRRLKGKK